MADTEEIKTGAAGAPAEPGAEKQSAKKGGKGKKGAKKNNEGGEDELVQVSKSELNAIADRLDKLEDENDSLRQAVSQNKLVDAENKKKPKELPKAFLKVHGGKVVIGWKSETAKLIMGSQNPNTPIGEILQTRLFYIDGSNSGVIDQVELTRTEDRVWGRIVKKLEDNEVALALEKLETADRELIKTFVLPTEVIKINLDFLNP